MKQKTNKERLVCIESKLDNLIQGFSNHLLHHAKRDDRMFRLFLVLTGIVGSGTITIILTILFKP
jgi:hypothetical protein